MARVLLDTTILIDLLRGREGARTRFAALRAAGDAPYTCAVNVDEVVRGLRPPERVAARGLLAGLRVAPLGHAEGWRAGEWRQRFAARGRTLPQADCLIAATAHTIGGRLATGNPRQFPMRGVAVEHWPVGE
jgi:predicted nucleic acid-binding protein